jgi:SAM-dependent methyltransferase
MEIPRWLAASEPQMPLELLVERVNEIFHSFAARRYDQEHPEIHQQLPPIWREMLAELPPDRRWNVLDVGGGTGFEANLLLGWRGQQVDGLTVYDPSAQMMARCRQRLQRFAQVTCHTRIEEALSRGPFNLLLTNSLLHHLPDIQQMLQSLLPQVSEDAVWLAGHEPSSRFFLNRECLELLARYRQVRRYRRWLAARNYLTQLRGLFAANPLEAAAKMAYQQGLFGRRPSSSMIDRLVDFHVLHSGDEVSEGRGLDLLQMKEWFSADWDLRWSKSYAFLGPYPYTRTPRRWVERARALERRFPEDGANLCMVWYRKPNDRRRGEHSLRREGLAVEAQL